MTQIFERQTNHFYYILHVPILLVCVLLLRNSMFLTRAVPTTALKEQQRPDNPTAYSIRTDVP